LPQRQDVDDRRRSESDRQDEQQLADAERAPGVGAAARDHRPDEAADPEADEKHRENDRERVDAGAKQQRQLPRPDDLGAKCGQARQSGDGID
jgi:hypothetical protein